MNFGDFVVKAFVVAEMLRAVVAEVERKRWRWNYQLKLEGILEFKFIFEEDF